VFITFEGTEGSGKSVQARLLMDRLLVHSVPALAAHEPGGTLLGDQLRQLVLVRDDLEIVPRAEALLMNASRAQ
jgi:dTMP kinase